MGVETNSIARNLDRVRKHIAAAAERAGRKVEEITLVAISKTFPAQSIREACNAGVRHFGENRVQEWESKRPSLEDLPATWHLVGHLQSNKAARAAQLFHTIDSVDSLHLARKIEDAQKAAARVQPVGAAGAGSENRRLPVLIQVHLGGEESKSGVEEADLFSVAQAILELPHLELRGLMCLPPYAEDPEQARPYFRRLRELQEDLRRRLRGSHHLEATLPELSMGMSHDFEVAIEEGATQVRLGTALFGSRKTK